MSNLLERAFRNAFDLQVYPAAHSWGGYASQQAIADAQDYTMRRRHGEQALASLFATRECERMLQHNIAMRRMVIELDRWQYAQHYQGA